MACITSLLECDMTEMPKRTFGTSERSFRLDYQEHMKDNRSLTTIKIFKQDGRLKILELSDD